MDSGQYDDMDGPAHSILFDDEDPQHQAGAGEVRLRTTTSMPAWSTLAPLLIRSILVCSVQAACCSRVDR